MRRQLNPGTTSLQLPCRGANAVISLLSPLHQKGHSNTSNYCKYMRQANKCGVYFVDSVGSTLRLSLSMTCCCADNWKQQQSRIPTHSETSYLKCKLSLGPAVLRWLSFGIQKCRRLLTSGKKYSARLDTFPRIAARANGLKRPSCEDQSWDESEGFRLSA